MAQPVLIQNGRITTDKQDTLSHGLGLENVRQLAEAHGGKLTLTCEQEIFTVTMEMILFKLSSMFMQAVLWVGELSISGACCSEYCQPKMPEKMLKK